MCCYGFICIVVFFLLEVTTQVYKEQFDLGNNYLKHASTAWIYSVLMSIIESISVHVKRGLYWFLPFVYYHCISEQSIALTAYVYMDTGISLHIQNIKPVQTKKPLVTTSIRPDWKKIISFRRESTSTWSGCYSMAGIDQFFQCMFTTCGLNIAWCKEFPGGARTTSCSNKMINACSVLLKHASLSVMLFCQIKGELLYFTIWALFLT